MIKPYKKFWIFFGSIISCVLLFLLLMNSYYSDYHTNLLPGVFIRDGSSDLRANNWSVPLVYDWDSDGRKDLLVGNRYIENDGKSYGFVNFFRNIGSDLAPAFNGSILIQACSGTCSYINVAAAG